jgi:hypothetical protein
VKLFTKRSSIILLLILSAVFLKELIFIFLIPPWQNHDEPAHFAYTQYLVEEKKLPVYQGAFTDATVLSFSQEYAESEIRTEATRLMKGSNKQYRLVHQLFNNPSIASGDIARQLSGLDRHPLNISTAPAGYLNLYYQLPKTPEYKNSAAVYQPLYYAAMAIPYSVFYHSDILTRMYAMRIFSSLIYLATIWLCYLLAKLITKNTKFSLTLCLLTGLLPVFSHLANGINNDILLIFLSTLSLYWCVRLIQNFRWREIIFLGITLGLGLLTKPQFIFMPLIAVIPFIYHFIKNTDIRKKVALGLVALILISLVLCAWWFVWSYQQYGTFFMSSSGENTAALATPASFSQVWPQYFQRWLYGFMSLNFIFGFATEMGLPIYIMGAVITAIILSCFGLLILVRQRWKLIAREKKIIAISLIISALLLELIFLLIFSKSLFLTGQARFPTDGRYYLPLIFVFSFFFLTGWRYLVAKKFINWAYLLICLIAIAINYIAIFQVIIPRFYL